MFLHGYHKVWLTKKKQMSILYPALCVPVQKLLTAFPLLILEERGLNAV